MKEILKLTLTLTIIAIVATALLSIVNDLTMQPIADAKAIQEAKALKAILPEFDNNPFSDKQELESKSDIFHLLTATNKDKVVGYAVMGFTDKGFSGRIEAMVGFDLSGAITKVMVTKHTETPGLGTKVCDRKVQKTIFTILAGKESKGLAPSIFLDKFDGVLASDAATVSLKGEMKNKDNETRVLDAISGATVSSNAMADAVNRICVAFVKFQKEQ